MRDRLVVEVMVNPDGKIWVDRIGEGRSWTGENLAAADAQAIAQGFGAAGVDLSRRIGELSDADERSRAAMSTQIQRLTVDRRNLYRSIVAQIERIANRLARARRLTKVTVGNSRPKGSIDLTAAIRAALTPF